MARQLGGTAPPAAQEELATEWQGKAAAAKWLPETDPKTGKTYYYNPQSGKTAWEIPTTSGEPDSATMTEPISTTTMTVPNEPTTIRACPGSLTVPGLGKVSLVSAMWNTAGDPAGSMDVANGRVTAHMGSRSYWASSCKVGSKYQRFQYAGVQLLGKTMRWTVSLTGLECGCNVALYLTSMRQNPEPSQCQDYYCDAGSVCGVSCDEVDLMEANKHAWFSTLHKNGDKNGAHMGYGHFVYDWNSTVYGPGAKCIDTNRPIDVAVSFPTGADGELAAVTVQLSQAGSNCPLSATLTDYGAGMARISAAMKRGMTPILSYWSSREMMWMDGVGRDGRGPCEKDTPSKCASSVSIQGFSIEGDPPRYTETI